MFSHFFQRFPSGLLHAWMLLGLCVLLCLLGIIGISQRALVQAAMPSLPPAVPGMPGGDGKPTIGSGQKGNDVRE